MHWANLGKGINLAVPPGDDELRATFLGCDHSRSRKQINGKMIECLKWDAIAGIRRGIAKYIAAVEIVCPGWTPLMYHSDVPLRHIETKNSIHRKPAITDSDTFVECPDCLGTFSCEFIKKHHTFPAGTQRKVTDVFAKEERANRLLPDSTESAALCPDGGMASCIAATAMSNESVAYVADLIDLAELIRHDDG